jgi:hypothetical protein
VKARAGGRSKASGQVEDLRTVKNRPYLALVGQGKYPVQPMGFQGGLQYYHGSFLVGTKMSTHTD